MKTKMNFLKTGLLALAVFCSAQTFGQVFPNAPTLPVNAPSNLNGGLVTFDGTNENFAPLASNTVLFFRPTTVNPIGSGVNLSATLTDAAGNAFASYLWYKVSYTGGTETEGTAIAGETDEIYTPTNLVPGYNKFRVRGEVGTGVSCPSEEYQDVIVYVLPQLNVGLSDVSGTLTYCEDDVPTGANVVQLTAGTITGDYTGNGNDYPKPGLTDAATDFSLSYHWFAVPASAPGTPIDLGTATTATVDLVALTATPLAPDTYTFYVDVEYAGSIRPVGSRTYVTYGGTGTISTTEVVVTATPGTPTITIDGVSD